MKGLDEQSIFCAKKTLVKNSRKHMRKKYKVQYIGCWVKIIG
jgi:hypothetical protein